MKTKLIILGSLVVVLLFGFMYVQNSNLIADDKDGKKNCSSTCTDKKTTTENKSSECMDKNMSGANTNDDDKNGYAVYEFVTDKIHCDGCKPGMTESLMKISGVKEIGFGDVSSDSKMTSVKVYFVSSETTPEVVAASVKEKGLSCDKDKCGDTGKCTSKNKTEKKL